MARLLSGARGVSGERAGKREPRRTKNVQRAFSQTDVKKSLSIFVEYHLAWTPTCDAFPPAGQLVYYRTPLYHFTGFWDANGQWRDARGRVERQPVIAWAPFAKPHADASRLERRAVRFA